MRLSSGITRAFGLLVFAISLTCSLCSCNSSGLTRGKAKAVIEQSDDYKLQKRSVFLKLNGPEMTACIKAGYLQWADRLPEHWSHLVVTERGKQFFDSASGTLLYETILQNLAVVPLVPVQRRVVEITGITDGENSSKIVEYKWHWDYDAQPQELKDILFKSDVAQPGKATLKLYDDGWRVVKFE